MNLKPAILKTSGSHNTLKTLPKFGSFSTAVELDHLGFTVASGTVTVTDPGGGNPIPEPSTILLLGTGIAGLLAWRVRKQQVS